MWEEQGQSKEALEATYYHFFKIKFYFKTLNIKHIRIPCPKTHRETQPQNAALWVNQETAAWVDKDFQSLPGTGMRAAHYSDIK